MLRSVVGRISCVARDGKAHPVKIGLSGGQAGEDNANGLEQTECLRGEEGQERLLCFNTGGDPFAPQEGLSGRVCRAQPKLLSNFLLNCGGGFGAVHGDDQFLAPE